jgi:predicted MPP superfamily phosphohydrolase
MAVSDTVHSGEFTHKILVWTNEMQRIPWWVMSALFLGIGWVVAASWPEETRWLALTFFAAAQLNAISLMLLPVFDVSHGPDRASSLGLALLMGIPVAILGLLNAPPLLAVAWMIFISLLALYGAWIEPFRIDVVRQRKSVPGWDAAHTLRVAHISDLHAEHFGRRERRLNALLNELEPDLIVFSGDFINLSYVKDPTVRDVVCEVVKAWDAPLGVYAVSGTSPEVDHPDDLDFYLCNASAESVVGRWVSVETPGGMLHIGGVPTWHVMRTDRAALTALLESRPEEGAQLLLVHTPDLAPDAAEAGIDLYLCGHTHGGQLCLPGGIPIVTGSLLGRRFARGRVELGGTTIYTARGLGFEGLGAPRARLFCRPEITLWEITA